MGFFASGTLQNSVLALFTLKARKRIRKSIFSFNGINGKALKAQKFMSESTFSCIGINEKTQKRNRESTFSCIGINEKTQKRMRESTFSCIDINRKAFEGMKFYTCFSNALLLPFHLANFTYEKFSTWSYCEIVRRLRQDGNLKHRIHIFDKQISSGDSRDGAWLSFLVSCKIHDRMKFLTHQDVCFEGHRAGKKNIVYVEAGKECKNVDIRWSMIHNNWKAEDKSLRCEKQEGGVWMRNLPTPTPSPKVFKW